MLLSLATHRTCVCIAILHALRASEILRGLRETPYQGTSGYTKWYDCVRRMGFAIVKAEKMVVAGRGDDSMNGCPDVCLMQLSHAQFLPPSSLQLKGFF